MQDGTMRPFLQPLCRGHQSRCSANEEELVRHPRARTPLEHESVQDAVHAAHIRLECAVNVAVPSSEGARSSRRLRESAGPMSLPCRPRQRCGVATGGAGALREAIDGGQSRGQRPARRRGWQALAARLALVSSRPVVSRSCGRPYHA